MSIEACTDMVAKRDPDRFAAAMLAPKAAQDHLIALYAFNLEVSRAPWVTNEPVIAAIRLQWWRDALEEIYNGEKLRAHEVVLPLAHTIDECSLPQSTLLSLIDAREADVERKPMSVEEIETYCAQTGGGLMGLGAKILGVDEAPLHKFGGLSGVAGFLSAIPKLTAAGWPVFTENGARWKRDGPNETFRAMIVDLASGAHAELNASAKLPRAALPVALAGWQTRRILKLLRSQSGQERVFSDAHLPSEARRRIEVLFRFSVGII